MKVNEIKEVEKLLNEIKMLQSQLEQKDIEFEEYKQEENNIKMGFQKKIDQLKKEYECKSEMKYLDLMEAIGRLNIENSKLNAENYQLKLDNEALHNKLCTKENLIELEVAYQSDISNNDEEIDYEAYSKALENVSLRKFNY